MAFRDREKKRLAGCKQGLFSPLALRDGRYARTGKEYDFCLHESCNTENLYAGIREEALWYFAQAKISWHDGVNSGPSNHLCCSQSACVNAWFPFVEQPGLLQQVLSGLGYPVDEVLPMVDDLALGSGEKPYVSFEWIGRENYLHEVVRGQRQRGQNATSADFTFRFRRTDGLIQLVLGEWKYTEHYSGSKLDPKSGARRLSICQPELGKPDCPIRLSSSEQAELYYEPFYQLMRLQLLARAMERASGGEMGADVVTVLHVSPRANRDFQQRVTAPGLKRYGSSVYEVWYALVGEQSFLGCSLEDLLPILLSNSPDPAWSKYMGKRYAGMR